MAQIWLVGAKQSARLLSLSAQYATAAQLAQSLAEDAQEATEDAAASIVNYGLQAQTVVGPGAVMDNVRIIYIRDDTVRTRLIGHVGPNADDIPAGGNYVQRVRLDRGGVISTVGSATVLEGGTDSVVVTIAGNFVDGDKLRVDITEVGLTRPGGNSSIELLP